MRGVGRCTHDGSREARDGGSALRTPPPPTTLELPPRMDVAVGGRGRGGVRGTGEHLSEISLYPAFLASESAAAVNGRTLGPAAAEGGSGGPFDGCGARNRRASDEGRERPPLRADGGGVGTCISFCAAATGRRPGLLRSLSSSCPPPLRCVSCGLSSIRRDMLSDCAAPDMRNRSVALTNPLKCRQSSSPSADGPRRREVVFQRCPPSAATHSATHWLR